MVAKPSILLESGMAAIKNHFLHRVWCVAAQRPKRYPFGHPPGIQKRSSCSRVVMISTNECYKKHVIFGYLWGTLLAHPWCLKP